MCHIFVHKLLLLCACRDCTDAAEAYAVLLNALNAPMQRGLRAADK